MTRDASVQAVHERLEHLVETMPQPDVEAGWAALVAQLEPPVAPVAPLHRPRPYKAIVLGVAAAILIGGSALAMVGHLTAPAPALSGTGSTGGITGPHNHASFSRVQSTHEPTSHHPRDRGTGSGHAGDGSHRHQATGSGGTSTPPSEPSTPPQQEPSQGHDPNPGTGGGDQGDNSQGDNSQGDSSQGGSSGGSGSGGSSGGSSGGGSGSGGSSGGGDQGSNGQ